MKNRKTKLAAVAGLFALACVVVSGCGGRTKPSTPEEKRFAESARAGIQSVCDKEKPSKECADRLMRAAPERESWERRKQKKLKDKERMARTVRAREPLRYPAKSGWRMEFAGHKMGKAYPPPVNGQTVFYVDVVNHYRPQVVLDVPYHGMQHLSLNLSPTSHRIFHMGMSRGDFTSRQELKDSGVALLDDLGKTIGRKLTGFRFEAPDWPYWPSRRGIWGGPKAELYVADESMWPTSKNIFAISDTHVGSCSIQVRLSIVNFTEYELSVSIHDEEIAAESDSEFVAAFRRAHDGKDYQEWWNERQARLAQEKQRGELSCNLTNRLDLQQDPVRRKESTVGIQQK